MSRRWQKCNKKVGEGGSPCSFPLYDADECAQSPPSDRTLSLHFLFWTKEGSILWIKSLVSHRGCLIQLLNHLCWRKKIIWMTSWPLFFQNHGFHFDIGLWTRCASIRSVLSSCPKKLAIEFFWYFVYLLVIQRWDVIKSKRSQYFKCFTS